MVLVYCLLAWCLRLSDFECAVVCVEKLNQGAVLQDLAGLLLDYAMLYQDNTIASIVGARSFPDTVDERDFEPALMRLHQDRFATVRVDWKDSSSRQALTDAEALALTPDPVDKFQSGPVEPASVAFELEWKQRAAEAAATKLVRHTLPRNELFDSGGRPWLPNRMRSKNTNNSTTGAGFKAYSNPYRTRSRRNRDPLHR